MGLQLREFLVPKVWLWFFPLGVLVSVTSTWLFAKYGSNVPYGMYVIPGAMAVLLAVAWGNVLSAPKIVK